MNNNTNFTNCPSPSSPSKIFSCGAYQTPSYSCNKTLNNFFQNYAPNVNPFNLIHPTVQQLKNLPGNGALMVSGLNYSNYGDFFNVNYVEMPDTIISNLLSKYCDKDEKVTVFMVQAPLSLINVSANDVVNKLNLSDKSKKIMLYLLNKTLFDKGNITSGDFGIFHSGLVFIKSSDVKNDYETNFPYDKIICSLELWGYSFDGGNLFNSLLPEISVDSKGNPFIDKAKLTFNTVLSGMPQLFGCDPGVFWKGYWTKFYKLGETSQNNIVSLFNISKTFYKNNPYYIATTVTDKDYKNYVPSITCETFCMDMIYHLKMLDNDSISASTLNSLKFSDVLIIGNNTEMININTNMTNINNYTNIIMKKISSIETYTDENPNPYIYGHALNILLGNLIYPLFKFIGENSDTLYTTIIIKNEPYICSIENTFFNESKIQMVYDNSSFERYIKLVYKYYV